MTYEYFTIQNYRAIKGPLKIDLASRSLVPLIGLNECGKTTVLQAIFAFDVANDSAYQGRHIKEVVNLYTTTNSTPAISAGIRGSKSSLGRFIDDYSSEESAKLDQLVTAPTNAAGAATNVRVKQQSLLKWKEDFKQFCSDEDGLIEIIRNLDTSKYSLSKFNSSGEKFTPGFCEFVVRRMPYILYNDDFQDRPPSVIRIAADNKDAKEWQQIFAKLFEEAEYSLIDAARVEDQRRRDSIVSDVQSVLNRTLAKAWKSFHLDRNRDVKIRLTLKAFVKDNEGAELTISIVEKIGDNERFFDVVDRSKGFLWFYNFVMKTEFNPKRLAGRGDTIYLLDEPGSYLHSAAQSRLCEKLKQISRNDGKVIFCTHSPHLLNPEYIPVNDIHIVSKSSKKEISIERVPLFGTSTERLIALQPLYEALQIQGQQYRGDGSPMLAVEGINDKYAISVFLPNSSRYEILPGTNANSIVKSIQFLNAFGTPYVAIWDNDAEGRREMGRAKAAYGSRESERFVLLPAEEGGDRKMEGMFSMGDLAMLRELLKFDSTANYGSVMVTLFYASAKTKLEATKRLSPFARGKFETLQSMIEAKL